MSKVFKKVAPVASIALPFVAPGLGTALGTALGATGTTASALGSGLIGAGLGAASGGGLKGAALGGLGSAIGAGLGGFGAVQGPTLPGAESLGSSGFGLLGELGSVAPETATAISDGLGTVLSGGAGVGTSGGGGLGNVLVNALGSYEQDEAIKDALRTQNAAISEAQGNLGQFTPDEFVNDSAYQFQVDQGQQALDRANAARGGFFSGAALREAQRYGQGVGSRYYDDAYNRYLAETDRTNNLILNRGDINAGAQLSRSGSFGSSLLQGLYG